MSSPSPDPLFSESAADKPSGYSLLQLFTEGFLMLGRYFIIVYPVFFYFILSSIFIPKSAPNFGQWVWWIIVAGWMGILYIFKAGWSAMMYQAVQEWQVLKEKLRLNQLEKSDIQPIPFSLLKNFLPGMGEFGVPFLMGGILWFLAAALIFGTLLWLGMHFVGLPHSLITLLEKEPVNPNDVQKLLLKANPAEQTQLAQWNLIFLGLLLLFAVYNGLTFFWQQFIIIKQCNPFQAFFLSGRHACKHPFQTLVLMLSFGFAVFCFSFVTGLSDIGTFFGNFLLIITMVFFGLLLFSYIAHTDDHVDTPAAS
jgi:hypothetical protein